MAVDAKWLQTAEDDRRRIVFTRQTGLEDQKFADSEDLNNNNNVLQRSQKNKLFHAITAPFQSSSKAVMEYVD